jgi:hypothetical protein
MKHSFKREDEDPGGSCGARPCRAGAGSQPALPQIERTAASPSAEAQLETAAARSRRRHGMAVRHKAARAGPPGFAAAGLVQGVKKSLPAFLTLHDPACRGRPRKHSQELGGALGPGNAKLPLGRPVSEKKGPSRSLAFPGRAAARSPVFIIANEASPHGATDTKPIARSCASKCRNSSDRRKRLSHAPAHAPAFSFLPVKLRFMGLRYAIRISDIPNRKVPFAPRGLPAHNGNNPGEPSAALRRTARRLQHTPCSDRALRPGRITLG